MHSHTHAFNRKVSNSENINTVACSTKAHIIIVLLVHTQQRNMRLHKINRKQLLKIRFGNPFCEARKCYVVHNIVGYIAEQCYTLTLEHQLKLIDEGEWPCSRAHRSVHKTELLLHTEHITLFRFFYMFNLCTIKCWNARSDGFRLWKIFNKEEVDRVNAFTWPP